MRWSVNSQLRVDCRNSASCRFHWPGAVQGQWLPMRRNPDPERPDTLAFMKKAIKYEEQCRAQGRLPAVTGRALWQIANGEDVASVAPAKLTAGSLHVREWNGRTYQPVSPIKALRWTIKPGNRSLPSPNTSQERRGPGHSSLVPTAGVWHEEAALRHLHPKVF